MKPLEELTYRGQARRIRGIATRALDDAGLAYDRVSLIFHGENTTFRARSRDGDYLVRVHRPGYQTHRTITSELELLHALQRDTDLIVPDPVTKVQTLGAPGVDPRHVVVFRWLEGRFHEPFTPHSMRRLGDVAAKLHRFAETFVPSSRFERRFATVEGMTGENMGGDLSLWPEDSRSFVEGLVERAADVLDDLGRERSVWGIIHNDLHHGNRLVCAGGKLGVIDFDDAVFGHYLTDLAVMLGYPFRKKTDEYGELREAFIGAYREVRPISDEEVAMLPAFFTLRTIMITLWVIGRARDNPYFAQRAPNALKESVTELHALNELDW